jgi:hypothetical protein
VRLNLNALLAVLAVVAVACSGAAAVGDDATTTGGVTTTAVAADTTSAPVAQQPDAGSSGSSGGSDVIVSNEVTLPGDLGIVTEPWPTDWTRRTIELDELLIGIAAVDPRDRIRPIDLPVYESVDAADGWLIDSEQGILLDIEGFAMFFPIRILISHEIVNDQRGEIPFSLTYCPLCNTAAAFDRRVDGEVLRFGVSGLLRNSDLVMWDDLTTSLWQQITGESIVGAKAGTQLEFLPTALVRWADFRSEHPAGEVLSQASGPFNYGSNGYVGYSSRPAPFGRFFENDVDPRFEALSRVVGVRVGDTTKAYPFGNISEVRAVNDEIDGTPIAIWWGAPDTADSLDTPEIGTGQGIGTGIAFLRELNGETLTFTANGDDTFTDAETGTTWNLLGTAIDGPLTGTSLETALHQNEFWFAWAAFNEGSEVYGA